MTRAQRRAAGRQARAAARKAANNQARAREAWRNARSSTERMAAGRAGGLRFVGDPGPRDPLTPGAWEMMLGLPAGSLALAWAPENDRSPSAEAARELFWRTYSAACERAQKATLDG